jgi:hypothetical protein
MREFDLISRTLFIIFASFAFVLLALQLIFVKKMKIASVYLIGILSICICYENAVLASDISLSSNVPEVKLMRAVQALEVPLFILCLYETIYHLYEEKDIPLLCISLTNWSFDVSYISLWVARLLALGILAVNLAISFNIQDECAKCDGGYVNVSNHAQRWKAWVILVPTMTLTLLTFVVGYMASK